MTFQTIKYYLIGLTTFFYCTSYAEKSKGDSIKLLIKNSKSDTNRVILYQQMALAYFSYSQDTCAYYSEIGINLTKKLNFVRGEALLLDNLGYVEMYRGNYEKAISYHLKALSLHQKIGDKLGSVSSLNGIGFIYDSQKNSNKALEYFEKSLSIMKEIHNQNGVIKTEGYIASVNIQKGKYQEALNFYLKENTIAYYKMTGNIGDAYEYTSIAYRGLNKLDSALNYCERAINIFRKDKENSRLADALLETSKVYLKQSNYYSAIETAEEAFKLAEKMKVKGISQDASKILSECYEKENDFKKAYKYQSIYLQLKDSLSTGAIVVQLEAKYKTEQANLLHQKEIELQKSKEKMTRLVSTIIAFSLLIIAFSFYLRYRSKQKSNKELSVKNSKIEEAYKIIEKKNTDILSSIRYAKRIQTSLLPTEKYIERVLNDKDKSTGA